MQESNINRINELYHKSKTTGLTPEEAAEQKELRAKFIENIKANVRGQLNNISIVEPDGTVTDLNKAAESKHKPN